MAASKVAKDRIATMAAADALHADAYCQTRRGRRRHRWRWAMPCPLWFFTLVSPFWELARELREMLYLNSFSYLMDPAPCATGCRTTRILRWTK